VNEPHAQPATQPASQPATAKRFDDRARDYARYRPTYPPQAIDAILAGLPAPASLTATDIGAGTGISARLLADRGLNVVAIEPNAAMRDAAEPHARVRWQAGTGEATGLPDSSLDLILCAQSYHWLDPQRACAEFARILTPKGRLALMWNDGDESSPVAGAYYDLLREASDEGPTVHQQAAHDPGTVAPFENMQRLEFHHDQLMDEAALIGRAMSASYVPKEGPRADKLVKSLRELFHREAVGGQVSFAYRVFLYLADV